MLVTRGSVRARREPLSRPHGTLWHLPHTVLQHTLLTLSPTLPRILSLALSCVCECGHTGTPLLLAVRIGNLHDLVRCLIESGADVTALCKGKSALHEAVIHRDTPMVLLLLDAASKQAPALGAGTWGGTAMGTPLPLADFVNCAARDGWSALGLAARAGDAAIVQALIDAGADKAAVMQNGKSALDIAKGQRSARAAEVVRLLEA